MPGLVIQRRVTPIVVPPPAEVVPDFCYCAPLQCEYREKVFALADSAAPLYNDQTSFLFRRAIPSDTISLTLWKNGIQIASITATNAAFTLYSFAAQPFYTGLLVKWHGVRQLHGFGYSYQIKASYTIAGQPQIFESRIFDLLPYSPQAANGTVRMEVWQNGTIYAGEFDYSSLIPGGWYSQYRLPGTFAGRTPELENDRYLTSRYQSEQIQSKIRHFWTLETEFLPPELSKSFTEADMLGDRIQMTGYSIFADGQYSPVDVYPDSIERRQTFNKKQSSYTVKMYERNEGYVKRRF